MGGKNGNLGSNDDVDFRLQLADADHENDQVKKHRRQKSAVSLPDFLRLHRRSDSQTSRPFRLGHLDLHLEFAHGGNRPHPYFVFQIQRSTGKKAVKLPRKRYSA